jgi:arginine deiminase
VHALSLQGGLHPRASLYERPVNLDSAKQTHSNFRHVLREHGVKVLTVREILAYGVEDHIGARVDLEKMAMRALTYEMAEKFQVRSAAGRRYATRLGQFG